MRRSTTPPDEPDPSDTLQQLTPQQCAELSAATQDLPHVLSVTDAEQIEEERFGGKPLKYGTPGEAVAAMERRIAEMRAEKAKCLDTLEDCTDDRRQDLLKDLDQLNQQIADTQARLDAYRFQQDHEN
jgi:hypothetical protein